MPRPVFTVASIISLVPGMDAYNALLALNELINGSDQDLLISSIITLFHCGMRATAILLAMCLGIAIMPLFFYRYRFHHL